MAQRGRPRKRRGEAREAWLMGMYQVYLWKRDRLEEIEAAEMEPARPAKAHGADTNVGTFSPTAEQPTA